MIVVFLSFVQDVRDFSPSAAASLNHGIFGLSEMTFFLSDACLSIISMRELLHSFTCLSGELQSLWCGISSRMSF